MGCKITDFDITGPARNTRHRVVAATAKYKNADDLSGFVFWIDGKFAGFAFSEAGIEDALAEKPIRVIGYTSYGNVRGCCGHRHRSREAAMGCIARDEAGCAKQGGYSDRKPVVIGHDAYLYYGDDAGNELDMVWPAESKSNGAVRFGRGVPGGVF